MANGNGIGGDVGDGVAKTEHWRNLDDVSPGLSSTEGAKPPPDTIIVVQDDAEEPVEEIGIREADGSLIINLDGRKPKKLDPEGAKVHGANLAEYIDEGEQVRICDDLLNGIESDLASRQDWIDRRASGIKHLALKIDAPRSPSADADTAVEGQSTIRSPILLDAVLRFQANARGELLPAGGPVKIRNDSVPKTRRRDAAEKFTMPIGDLEDDNDILADCLEDDLNHYLTVVDREYYPDTTRMFFMQGYGGCGFKKIYRCPIRRRPVSRAIDANDIIVSDNEVSLHECGRVTHRIEMRQSVLRRMQLAGTYRDMDILPPTAPDPDAVERAEQDAAGLAGWSQRPQDYKHTIYECYCELDIAGFEHKENRKYTGLPLPYRVTIDRDSQKILEVRRNWKENDERYLKKMPIVKYPFVEGIGFYGIGLLNIMGNATAAVTTAWRLALDSAGFASWPGFLYSETVGRQDTMTFRVGLGSGVRINTGGQPINQNVMALPYKDVTPGLVQVTSHIEEEARRVGGTPEISVGEGRQDVPVGTTLAMLDQAVKVIDAVHKGMHSAQSEEFSLLRELFIDDPESLICNNPKPSRQWELDDLKRALEECNLTPQSDPNTPSHTIRVMKAVALLQLVQMNPGGFNLGKVAAQAARMAGLGDISELQQDNPQTMDPKVMKGMADVKVKIQELAQQEQDSQRKMAMDYISDQMDLLKEQMQLQNNREERVSRERVEAAKMANERMQLAEGALIHPLATEVAKRFAAGWGGSSSSSGGMAGNGGGRVL